MMTHSFVVIKAMPEDFQARVNLDECSVGTGVAYDNYNFFTDNKCFCHKGEYEGTCNNHNSNGMSNGASFRAHNSRILII